MAPHITPFEFESPVYAGENVQVTCHVPKGDRPLSIYWQFESAASNTRTSEPGFSTTVIGDRANFLSITSAGPNHVGNYTCFGENAAGVDSFTAQLSVIGTYRRVFKK